VEARKETVIWYQWEKERGLTGEVSFRVWKENIKRSTAEGESKEAGGRRALCGMAYSHLVKNGTRGTRKKKNGTDPCG